MPTNGPQWCLPAGIHPLVLFLCVDCIQGLTSIREQVAKVMGWHFPDWDTKNCNSRVAPLSWDFHSLSPYPTPTPQPLFLCPRASPLRAVRSQPWVASGQRPRAGTEVCGRQPAEPTGGQGKWAGDGSSGPLPVRPCGDCSPSRPPGCCLRIPR